MRKTEFHYSSTDGQTTIHGIEWAPESEIKGVLQICHGMVEYIDRYDEFARHMVKHGFCVIGHDHLGHGKSVRSEEYYGIFPSPAVSYDIWRRPGGGCDHGNRISAISGADVRTDGV